MRLPRAIPRPRMLLLVTAVPLALALAGCADEPTSPGIRPNIRPNALLTIINPDDPGGGGGSGGTTPRPPAAPTIAYKPTPATPDGDNDWYRSDVTLEWTISYNTTDAPTLTGCNDQSANQSVSIIADQGATTYSCSATNSVGTTTPAPVSIRRDATPPVVAVSGVADGATYVEGAVPTAACETTDALSGVATSATPAGSGGPLGMVTVTCSGAADEAGNEAPSVSATYRVTAAPVNPIYVFQGFAAPVTSGGMNVAKAGQTIPLKWRLLDSHGVPVTELTRVTVTVTGLACSAESTADLTSEAAAGGSGLQNLGNGYYQFNWKTPKGYANSCKTMRLELGAELGDAPPPTATFQFSR